jgi:hypothetical protein
MIQLSGSKSIKDLDQLYSWSLIIGRSVNLGERFTSPFRTDDKTPDCILNDHNGVIRFGGFSVKDKMHFGKHCIEAWMYLRGLEFYPALDELLRKAPIKNRVVTNTPKKEKAPLLPFVIPYTPQGLQYWRNIGIDISNEQRVKQIEGYTQYDYVYFPVDEIAFTYIYVNRYKIYRPFADKKNKWKSNVIKSDTWFTDNNAEKTIIAKAAKCQLVLELLLKTNYNYTHPQSESQIINLENGIAIMDNDEAGIDACKEYTKLGISSRIIPVESKCKDISEYIGTYGRFETLKLLWLMLERKKYLVLHPESEFLFVEEWNDFFQVDWSLEQILDVLMLNGGFTVVRDRNDVALLISESKNEIDNIYWFYIPEDRGNIAIQVDVFLHSVTLRDLKSMYHTLRSFYAIDLKKFI